MLLSDSVRDVFQQKASRMDITVNWTGRFGDKRLEKDGRDRGLFVHQVMAASARRRIYTTTLDAVFPALDQWREICFATMSRARRRGYA
jgi:hypothetical protein